MSSDWGHFHIIIAILYSYFKYSFSLRRALNVGHHASPPLWRLIYSSPPSCAFADGETTSSSSLPSIDELGDNRAARKRWWRRLVLSEQPEAATPAATTVADAAGRGIFTKREFDDTLGMALTENFGGGQLRAEFWSGGGVCRALLAFCVRFISAVDMIIL